MRLIPVTSGASVAIRIEASLAAFAKQSNRTRGAHVHRPAKKGPRGAWFRACQSTYAGNPNSIGIGKDETMERELVASLYITSAVRSPVDQTLIKCRASH
jgi:hypothetical protein